MIYKVFFTEGIGTEKEVTQEYEKFFPYYKDLKDNEITQTTKQTIIKLLANKDLSDLIYHVCKFSLKKKANNNISVKFSYKIDKEINKAKVVLVPIENSN